MEVKLTKEQLLNVFNLLVQGSFSKVSDPNDKFQIINIVRQIKSEVKEFNEIREKKIEELKPENLLELQEKYSQILKKDPPCQLPKEEQEEVTKQIKAYQEALNKALREEIAKEILIVIGKPISDTSFSKLIDSNPNWTISQSVDIQDLLQPNKR